MRTPTVTFKRSIITEMSLGTATSRETLAAGAARIAAGLLPHASATACAMSTRLSRAGPPMFSTLHVAVASAEVQLEACMGTWSGPATHRCCKGSRLPLTKARTMACRTAEAEIMTCRQSSVREPQGKSMQRTLMSLT